MKFFKYNGCGNDFILFEEKLPSNFPQLCHRKIGIGADGALLLSRKGPSHFQMRIFNSDGSEAEMCGNGLRVSFCHLLIRFPNEAPFKIDSLLKTHQAKSFENGEIEVELGEIKIIHQNRLFDGYACDLIDTGVPHLILLRKPLNLPFIELAAKLRRHADLPKGANVNLVERLGDVWKVTTYERGVEGITDACGTGVAASAISLALYEKLSPPLPLTTPGGGTLTVSWEEADGAIRNVALKGKATLTFEGSIHSSIMEL